MMKLSAYGYLFLARKNAFDLDGMVINFTSFFDETVIATIRSDDDDTYQRLMEWQDRLGEDRFKVITCYIDINKSNRWDGDLKTAALSHCAKSTKEDPRCYVLMDGDERVPLSHRGYWDVAARTILQSDMDGLLLPVIDLWGDEKHVRADQTTGFKFRMHRDTVIRRGVIPQAELGNGRFDTGMSDSTEPLTADGQLARFGRVYAYSPCYVLHYGHLDKERRAKLNREFWREHWRNRSGEEPKMALDASELDNVPLREHGLDLS